MGHDFDSPESRADSRINITDNHVFHGNAPRSVARPQRPPNCWASWSKLRDAWPWLHAARPGRPS